MRSFSTLIFFFLVSTLSFAQMANRLDKLEVNDVTAKKLDVVSTTSGSKPCPAMTQDQRNAIASPVEGQCIYNSIAKTLNLYNGSAWVEVAGGGGGGINNWQTSFFYDVGAVVIESDKIYQAITQHTSTVFLSDISNWVELANDVSSSVGVLSMSNGGTDKSLTPLLGGLVYTDDLSMEVLPAGTSGQLLKSNGSAAPEWTTLSVDDASFSGVLSMEKGGTNNPLTATLGAVAYSDIDSLELLSPGTPGQVLQTNGSDAPSFVNKSIPGKLGDGSTVIIEELQAPNNQMTQVDTNKHLIESGNKNILQNPSFESLLEGGSIPYWNYGFPVPAQEESSTVIDGKKLAVFSVSSEPILLTQSSTLYANAFADGVQGLVSVRVKSDVALKVCSISAGTTSTSNCVDVVPDNKWGFYKVPTILGATSNGISIASSGPVTGTVYIDDAFVGAQDVKQDVSTCNSIECETEFVAFISNTGVVTGENYDWINGNCSVVGISGRACTYNVSAKFTKTLSCSPTSGEYHTIETGVSSNGFTVYTYSNTHSQSLSPIKVDCTRSGSDFTNAKRLASGSVYSEPADTFSTDTNTLTHKATAIVDSDPIGTYNTYSYAANTNTKTICATAPSVAPTKADGFKIFTRAYNVASTCGNPARVEIKLGKELKSKSLDLYKSAGKVTGGSLDYAIVDAGSSRGFYYKDYNENTGILVLDAGVNALVSIISNLFNFSDLTNQASGYLVINAQKAKEFIIGDFDGLEKCADSYECTDTFSAKVSATGVVSEENIDWISGNASITDTSKFSMAINPGIFSVNPNCIVSMSSDVSNVSQSAALDLLSATTIQQRVRTLAGGGKTAQPFTISCQKQGADYIGKTTAKAVASDQNVRSIGAVGVDIQSVYFGGGANCANQCNTIGACTVCSNRAGTKITSVQAISTTGAYRINGIDGTKYNCFGAGVGGQGGPIQQNLALSTSTYAYVQAWAGGTVQAVAQASVTCIGIP